MPFLHSARGWQSWPRPQWSASGNISSDDIYNIYSTYIISRYLLTSADRAAGALLQQPLLGGAAEVGTVPLLVQLRAVHKPVPVQTHV